MVARKRWDAHANAILQGILAQVGAPRPHCDRDVDRIVGIVDAHLAVAEIDERSDVAFADVIDFDRINDGLFKLLMGKGHLHTGDMGRLQEAFQMLR